jgi:sugar lactone lactonase YvrE
MYEVNLVYDAQAQLGEGPVWNPINARLYWVDILASRIHIYDPSQPNDSSYIEVGPHVSSVIPRQSGGLVLTLQDGFYAYDPESAELTRLAKVESPELGNRFNDGKCDPMGRYLAGTMSLNDKAGNGKLYSLDIDHTVETLVSEVTISNGLAWTSDGTTLYFIDTPTRQVVAYDYDLTTG